MTADEIVDRVTAAGLQIIGHAPLFLSAVIGAGSAAIGASRDFHRP
jgi:hypothetical protein